MKNLSEINLIRAIMCIFVVMTHSITNYLRNAEVDLNGSDQYIVWIRYALLCATPIFILLSETLISKNYINGLKKGFFRKRIQYILFPYIIVGLIFSYRSASKDELPFLDVVIDQVVFGEWYGFFVLVIFQFYILHWLLGKFLAKINPIAPLIIAFLVSFSHSYGFVHVPEYKELILTEYPFWYRTHIFLWLFYFVAAFYIGQYYETIMNFLVNKIWIPLFAVAASFLVIMYDYWELGYRRTESERYDMLLYALSVFFLLVVLIRKLEFQSEALVMISHFSFFIYLTHKIILPYFVNLSMTFGDNFFVYNGIMTFLCLGSCIGGAFLLYQSKITRLATGRIKFLDAKMPPVVKPEAVSEAKKLEYGKKTYAEPNSQ